MEIVIINARINSEAVFTGTDAAELSSICTTLGVKQPLNVFDTNQLLEVLETNMDKRYLLFSNFPPNSSYPNSKGFKGNFRQTNAWAADSYSNSESLFTHLNSRFKIDEAHFISGAPSNMLRLDSLQLLLPDTLVTLKRNKDFSNSKDGSKTSYRLYFAGRIKDFVSKYQ